MIRYGDGTYLLGKTHRYMLQGEAEGCRIHQYRVFCPNILTWYALLTWFGNIIMFPPWSLPFSDFPTCCVGWFWLLTMSSHKSACALLCIGIWFTLRVFIYFSQASKNLLVSNPFYVILVFWFSLKPYTCP